MLFISKQVIILSEIDKNAINYPTRGKGKKKEDNPPEFSIEGGGSRPDSIFFHPKFFNINI